MTKRLPVALPAIMIAIAACLRAFRSRQSIFRIARRTAAGLVAAVLLALVATRLDADQLVRGRNENVIGGPTFLTLNPLDMLGDVWNNMQVEPNCAIDASNPAVIFCSAVDYRWVDLKGGADGVHLDSWNMVAQSTNGGTTWTSRVHPGSPLDPNDGVLKKYTFAADPIVRPLAAGGFVHVGLAANRGENATGAIYASIWFNLSDKEDDPEPIENATPGGAVELMTGNAGQFDDRPSATTGEPTGKMCTHTVPRTITHADGTTSTEMVTLTKPCTPIYVVVDTFVGSGNNPRSKFYFLKSYNNGKGFTQPSLLSESNSVGQGIQVVKIHGSKKLMVFWRRGRTNTESDAIMVSTSNNDGDSWTKARVFREVCPADWQTSATTFRVRTIPDSSGDRQRAYVVWSERRDTPNGACTGGPDSGGPARVWMATTTDGVPTNVKRVDQAYTGPANQIFPTVAVTNGNVHVAWLDFRNDASKVFQAVVDETCVVQDSCPSGTERNRHTADMFGALAPTSANPNFAGSVYQISKYIFGKPQEDAPNAPLRQLHWNVVNARTVNRMRFVFPGDYNHTTGELLVPTDPVLQPGRWAYNDGGPALPPSADVMHTFWADGRNVKLIPDEPYGSPIGSTPRPYNPPDLDLALLNDQLPPNSIYDPTQPREMCTNGDHTGTKNLDIYTSRTTQGLYAFAPWNNKATLTPPDQNGQQRQIQRAFVVVVQHTQPQPQHPDPPLPPKPVRLTIVNPNLTNGRASFKQFAADPVEEALIPAGTAIARTVFVNSDDLRPAVRVEVVELEPDLSPPFEIPQPEGTAQLKAGGQKITVFLNPDPSAPVTLRTPDHVDPTAPDFDVSKFEVHDVEFSDAEIQDISLTSVPGGQTVAGQGPGDLWDVPGGATPGWKSPGWKSPGWKSPGWKSQTWQDPGWKSPGWKSPGWKSEGWETSAISDSQAQQGSTRHVRRALTNVGNTLSAYDIRVLVNGTTQGFNFQLVAYELYTSTAIDGCEPRLVGDTQVLLNIPNVDVSAVNFNSPPAWSEQNATVYIAPGKTIYVDLVVFDPNDRVPTFNPNNVVFKATPHAVNTIDAPPFGEVTTPPPVVSGAPGTNLSFVTQPSDTIADQSIAAFQVRAEDNTGAALPGVEVTVAISNNPGGGTLSPPSATTETTNSSGIATFSGLSINRGEHGYTLEATAAGGAIASSVPFDIIGFGPTGTMTAGRRNHTATRLNDGSVLIAGGLDTLSNGIASAERYDPATRTFTATEGWVGSGRGDHTATLLNDGRLLIAGGRTTSASTSGLNSAVIFDPTTGAFTATGNMTTSRHSHTATRLNDGRVLIAGGVGPTGVGLGTAEIFNPTTGAFTATGSMSAPSRFWHTAMLLLNGQVLVAGGAAGATAELFDPAGNDGVGAFTNTGALNANRFQHTATLLGNGWVLVAGGFGTGEAPGYLASAELFNPAAGTFTTTGSMTVPRRSHAATPLSDGHVLVSGGFNVPGASPVFLNSAEVYTFNFSTNTGSFAVTGSMAAARDTHTLTLLFDEDVLATGGSAGAGALSSAELYHPLHGAPLVNCLPASGGDFIFRGFYVPNYPGSSLRRVDLLFSANVAGTYTLSLTARQAQYGTDGPLVGTSTATVTLTDNNRQLFPASFSFPNVAFPVNSDLEETMTFEIRFVDGPAGGANNVYYAVLTSNPSCPAVETEDTAPPLSIFRRNGVGVRIFGDPPPIG